MIKKIRASIALALAAVLLFSVVGQSLTFLEVEAASVTSTIMVGKDPFDLAVNPTTNKLYVLHSADSVLVQDLSLKMTADTITLDYMLSAVAVNPNTNMVYVAQFDNKISVIGPTNKVVGTITLGKGEGPRLLAVNPNTNKVYVTNWSDSSVSVIDGATKKVVTTIPVGKTPQGLDVNPNTNMIYASGYASATLSVIDGSTNRVVDTIELEWTSGDVVVNPKTNMIYVAQYDNKIYVIDGSTNTVVTTIMVDDKPGDLAVNPKTNMIYVTHSASNSVSVIDGATNRVIGTVAPLGGQPGGVTVNPNTNMMYVTNGLDDTVSVIDGKTVTSSTPPEVFDFSISASERSLTVTKGSEFTITFTVRLLEGKAQPVTLVVDSPEIIESFMFSELAGIPPFSKDITFKIFPDAHKGTYSLKVEGKAPAVTRSVTITLTVGETKVTAGAITPEIIFDKETYNANERGVIRVISPDDNTDSERIESIQVKLKSTTDRGGLLVTLIESGTSTGIFETMFSLTTDRESAGTMLRVSPVDTITVEWRGVSASALIEATQTTKPLPATRGEPSEESTIKVGDLPRGMALNPNTNMIYVTNANSDTVSVIDGSTNIVLKTINVGRYPFGIAVNPNTNMVYVTNPDSKSVSVIDGSTNTVAQTIHLGYGPYEIAVNPNMNMVYVSADSRPSFGFNDHLVVIDGSMNSVVTDIELDLSTIAVNPSTNIVYAIIPYDSSLAVIDGSTNSLATSVKLSDRGYALSVQAIAVNPNMNMIYAASFDDKSVYVIDGSTNSVVQTIQIESTAQTTCLSYSSTLSPNTMAVDLSTNMVYVLKLKHDSGNCPDIGLVSASISMIDGSTNGVITTKELGGEPVGIAVNPNTNKLYVSSGVAGSVTVYLINGEAKEKVLQEPEVEETTEAPITTGKPETGQIAEHPTISKGKKYTSPLAITADLSNLYVGKYATYDFNYLLQLPNEPEVFQMGKIEYRVNSYDSITREYTITTTSKLSSSNEVSSSDTETRTTDSSNPFEVENIMHLIDATFPGSSDINVEQTGSGVGKIRNQSYQTNDYKYLITKEQVLGRQSKPDGTAIEPILEVKISGELKVLKESGIPHTLSFKLEDAYLTGIEDEDTREEVLMDFDSFIKSMKETSFSVRV